MAQIINELSLVIPTKDDHLKVEKNLIPVYDFLKNFVENFEILIISNGSTKSSINYIDNFIQAFDYINHHKINISGKGAAVREGITNSKYDNVLFSDADFSVKINEFSKFVSNQKLKSPLVIGNRRNKVSVNKKTPFLRKITGHAYIKLINILFSLNIEDTQCGFKAIDKKLFSKCDTFKTNGFSFDIEIILLAESQDVSIIEVPVEYVHDSDSKVSVLIDTFKMLIEILSIKKNFD